MPKLEPLHPYDTKEPHVFCRKHSKAMDKPEIITAHSLMIICCKCSPGKGCSWGKKK